MNWLKVGLGIAPLIVSAVRAAQQVFTGSGRGAEKKEYVTQFVQEMIAAAETVVGHDIVNDTAVQTALSNAIDAIVAVEKAVAAAKLVKTANPTPASS